MNYIFCANCGSKIQYAYSKPNFCSKCGDKCGSGSHSSAKTNLSKETSTKNSNVDLDEDETNIDYLPDIGDNLDYDVEQYDNNIFTIGSLAGEKNDRPKSRGRGSKTLDDFIDDKRTD